MIRDLYDWVIITFWKCVIGEIKNKRWVSCKPTIFKQVKSLIKCTFLETKHESIFATIITFTLVIIMFIPLVIISYYTDLYVWRYQQRFPESML